jgi:hypothetical protein
MLIPLNAISGFARLRFAAIERIEDLRRGYRIGAPGDEKSRAIDTNTHCFRSHPRGCDHYSLFAVVCLPAMSTSCLHIHLLAPTAANSRLFGQKSSGKRERPIFGWIRLSLFLRFFILFFFLSLSPRKDDIFASTVLIIRMHFKNFNFLSLMMGIYYRHFIIHI